VAGGIGDRAFRGREPQKSRLAGHRCWVMHERTDTEVPQIGAKDVALCRPHGKQVVDVSGVELRRNGDRGFHEVVSISGRDNSPAFRSLGQMWKTRSKDSCLEFIEPRVDPSLGVRVLGSLTTIP